MRNFNLPKYIGEKIRTYRIQAKLTQEELAYKLDTKKATISNYETGYRTPQQDMLFKIAKVLDISINDLFPPTVVKNENSNIQAIYNQLEESRQKVVLETAQAQLQEQEQEQEQSDDKIVQFPVNKDVDLYGIMTAGYGTMNDGKAEPMETIQMPAKDVPAHYDLAFKVSGNSMYPTFENGEIIFVKKTTEVTNGMIGCVEINGDAFIKKMYVEDGRLRLVSLNNDYDEDGERLYPDFYADEEDEIYIIGKVVM